MKKIVLTVFVALVAGVSFGQNTFPSTGNAGIGITTPTGNLHIHGTADYIYNLPPDRFGLPGGTVNTGKTSRIALTNNATGVGSTVTDGALLRMSATSLVLENLENNGALQLKVGASSLYMSGSNGRFDLGTTPSGSNTYGKFNLSAADNGMYIETTVGGRYGLSIKLAGLTDNAIQVVGTSANTFTVKTDGLMTSERALIKNTTLSATSSDFIFQVENVSQKLLQLQANGLMRVRKIRVDADAWADFVFDENYKLMSTDELRAFISANHHLPNVPSAATVANEGIDLAEMNKILLQKVEELTLYMLEQQKQIDALKEKP